MPRNKLILVFLVATLAPLGLTLWVTTRLLELNVGYAARGQAQLDEVSRSLQKAGCEFYRRARASLKSDAQAGRIAPQRHAKNDPSVKEFWDSGEPERFVLSGAEGDRLDYLVRHGSEVWSYSTPLEVGMQSLTGQIARARESVDEWKTRDFRRGFVYTYGLLAVVIWAAAFALLVFLASRFSRPIQQLTAGDLGGGGRTPEDCLPHCRCG